MTMRLVLKTFISAVALASLLTAAEAATQIGKVVAVAGSPSASGPAGDRKLSAGAAVYEDDKITVSFGGNAQIILNDNTRLVVGPSSSLILDRFLMKGGSSAQKVAIKTLRGTFRFITGKSPKSAYQISTSSATIGIRGTGFDFADRGRTSVAVMNGNVQLCDNDRRRKGCVQLADTCEVGEAGRGRADEFTGADAGKVIVNRLPYILNQSPLRTQFHLAINRCRDKVAKYQTFKSFGSGNNSPQPKQDNRGGNNIDGD